MRVVAATLLSLWFLVGGPALAVDLKPCTGKDREKIACLEKQLDSVNNALETIVRKIDAELKALTIKLDAFAQRFDVATSNSVKYEERVVLKSDESNECITWTTKEGEVKSRGCPTYLNVMKWRGKRE